MQTVCVGRSYLSRVQGSTISEQKVPTLEWETLTSPEIAERKSPQVRNAFSCIFVCTGSRCLFGARAFKRTSSVVPFVARELAERSIEVYIW